MNPTSIAWTSATWNPFSGCKKISPGCAFCYAETLAERRRGTPAFPNGFDLTLRPHKLNEPRKLKLPARIFVNSMSDLFWEAVSNEYRDRVLDVIEDTPQHTYQVLTKRADVLLVYSRRRRLPPNFWAGVSIEAMRYAYRVDLLRHVDAEVRFLSCEPMLSELKGLDLGGVHWVIGGGESGAHLMQPKLRRLRALVEYDQRTRTWTPRPDRYHWVRGLRDQTHAAHAAFFFKQWGGYRPDSAGRTLDGQVWGEFPDAARTPRKAPGPPTGTPDP